MAQRSVLVTGASTGIGRACALRLAGDGHRVYAGVRRIADGELLRAEAEGIEPVLLDVTDPGQIASGVERLRADRVSLVGIVCNAGVVVSGPLEVLPIDDLRRQLEVNVVGQVAVVQAFLPLLRRDSGRIVLMSSIGGRLGQPLVGAYVASKHALEAIGDALRLELAPWGIEVSLVEPGAVQTPIWEKGMAAADTILEAMPAEARRLYGRAIAAMRGVAEREARTGVPAAEVAAAVQHALFATRPRTRYLVGMEARALAVLRRVPDRLRDQILLRATGLPRRGQDTALPAESKPGRRSREPV
jgi:NAD(P)-dependent dehydrogenase (short-subunit alcohol dehydrogenase family)